MKILWSLLKHVFYTRFHFRVSEALVILAKTDFGPVFYGFTQHATENIKKQNDLLFNFAEVLCINFPQ